MTSQSRMAVASCPLREALETIAARRSLVFGHGTMSANEAFNIATKALEQSAAPRTPASTGEVEVERLAKVLCDASGYDWGSSEYVRRDLCRRMARAALSALPPSSGWEPIETAPRDGRSVLLTDGEGVGEGFWDDAPMAKRAEAGWFWEMDRGDLLTAKNAHGITHWRPLPPPPSREG